MEKQYCLDKDCQEDWNPESPDCQCGHEKEQLSECLNYIGEDSSIIEDVQTEDSNKDLIKIPWHSNAMGAIDIDWLIAQKRPFIVGVVGPPSAGKTTLLATLFMLLRSGNKIGEYDFSGSYTLLGWEKIADFLSFFSHKKVHFPPHTSSNTARIAGLLHLQIKDSLGQFTDVLFTDTAGEWFVNWSNNANNKNSAGAKWINKNADAFIVVADSISFNKNTGKARHTLMKIVERMKNSHNNRPISLVWTKSDEQMKVKDLKSRITEKIKSNLPQLNTFETAVINQNSETKDLLFNILDLVNHLLTTHQKTRVEKPQIKVQDYNDFFFSIRPQDYYE